MTPIARISLLSVTTLLLACNSGEAANAENTQADAAAAAPASSQASEAAEASVRQFIDRLYGAYSDEGSGLDWMQADQVFEPQLAGAIAQAIAEAEADFTIPEALAADPICGCQDWGDFTYSVEELDVSGDKARAVVRRSNFGETGTTTLDLAKTPEGWRVFDVDSGFRKLLV